MGLFLCLYRYLHQFLVKKPESAMKPTTGRLALNSRWDVTIAFGRGHFLKPHQRKKAVKAFYPEVINRFSESFMIAVEYGLGMLDETKEELGEIIPAWLLLGKKRWEKIVRKAQELRLEVNEIFTDLEFLYNWARSLCRRNGWGW